MPFSPQHTNQMYLYIGVAFSVQLMIGIVIHFNLISCTGNNEFC